MLKWYEKEGVNDDVVISSRIRLARNTVEYPFSPRISSEQAHQLVNKSKEYLTSNDMPDMNFIEMDKVSERKKQELFEKHVINRYLVGRNDGAVAVSPNQGMAVLVNCEDHFRIHAMISGMDIEKCLESANSVDDYLDKGFEYAFSEQYGYKTTYPTNLGTGLRAAYKMHLPALANTKKLRLISGELGRFGVKLNACYGENDKGLGDIYQLTSQHTLGMDEEDIIKNLNDVAAQIVEQERKERQSFIASSHIRAEDEAYKSYGVLKYSRCLDLKNAMVLLSEIRMGQYCNILNFDSDFSVYGLMLAIQPYAIQNRLKKDKVTSEELSVERAKIIRESMPELR